MNAHRTVLKVDLLPLTGTRLQPTGFPDLGAAEFETGDGRKALIVESPQSMANRLEAATWDEGQADQVEELSALPYVRVLDQDGKPLSSSRQEAHRLASAYIMEGKVDGATGEEWLAKQFGLAKGRPLDYRAVAAACFRLDPISLIHGVFFARKPWPWQPKIARAVTSFIEAYDVRPAVSGGVKRDIVINEAETGDTARGYGSVPHHRVEYTAKIITAFFSVDLAQLRSYGLSESATALLVALADFEIASLLDGGLRLRTACDLVVDPREGSVDGVRPDAQDAAQRVAKLAAECSAELGPVTEVVWSGRGK
jgi:CRISPR-associated protein Csb1